MSSQTFIRVAPAEGTLSPASSLVYGTRDRDHVYPWNQGGPQPGEVWRVDTAFVTNVHTDEAFFTISIALNNVLRSAGTPAGDGIRYGNSLQPVSHYAWGRALAAGESEGIELGGEVLHGTEIGGTPPGYAIWLGAYPGTNVNPLGGGNDGVKPGIIISVHGERLA